MAAGPMRGCVHGRPCERVHVGTILGCSFRNGALLAAGTVFLTQGVLWASRSMDPHAREGPFAWNGYLLQIYAGYLLPNLTLLLYCLSCHVWHAFGIDYADMFSGDPRHRLDWREAAELPCWSFFLLGLALEVNFYYMESDSLYQYYPVLLIGLSVVLLFMPFRICYHRSRMWLLNSLWRVCLAGMYPVEWWDAYVADILCSLTYSFGNASLLFCLYARRWNRPEECDSSHSRALGFATTLPSIWRALQCIRRYWDTNRKSIHLLNCAKYILTVSFYVALSVYRRHETFTNRCIFIVLATVNSSVNSVWDLYHDWGLGDSRAKNPFLRRDLWFKSAWVYYGAILINVLLRFTWILYIAIPQQLQHSAVTSFGVSTGEVCRRALWSLFRIENEYCKWTSVEVVGEMLPHRSWPFLEIESKKAGDRRCSGAPERRYRSPTDSHHALIDEKPNARSLHTALPMPECVLSTSSCCSCDESQGRSA